MRLKRVLHLVTLAVVLGSPIARADDSLPNACSGVGQPCNTAPAPGGAYTAAGTCVATTCPHASPQTDGSTGTTQVPCNLCEASDGGAPDPKDGSTVGGGGGCSIGGSSRPELTPLVAAGAALLALSRRRRTPYCRLRLF